MTTEREIVIACMRVEDLQIPYMESSELICSYCQARVWLSPPTVRQVKGEHGTMDGVRLVCFPQCFDVLAKEPMEIRGPSEEVRQTVYDELKKRGEKL